MILSRADDLTGDISLMPYESFIKSVKMAVKNVATDTAIVREGTSSRKMRSE